MSRLVLHLASINDMPRPRRWGPLIGVVIGIAGIAWGAVNIILLHGPR